jgi:hypothetical protein
MRYMMSYNPKNQDIGYTDRVYDSRLEDKVRQIVRLESKLAYANQIIDDLKKQLEEFYNE